MRGTVLGTGDWNCSERGSDLLSTDRWIGSVRAQRRVVLVIIVRSSENKSLDPVCYDDEATARQKPIDRPRLNRLGRDKVPASRKGHHYPRSLNPSHPSFLSKKPTKMRFPTILPLLALLATPLLAAEVTTEYTQTKQCTRKTQRGDQISVHYRGTLASDSSEFDSSYGRGQPLSFTVGQGQVIKGWDEGLLEMCIGDKRVLTIPPEFGYGDRAMGNKIPAGSTLGEFHLGLSVVKRGGGVLGCVRKGLMVCSF